MRAADEVDLPSQRSARYDGVIQCGSRRLVVIEIKLYATARDRQAGKINAAGVKTETPPRLVLVKWHER